MGLFVLVFAAAFLGAAFALSFVRWMFYPDPATGCAQRDLLELVREVRELREAEERRRAAGEPFP